MIRNKLKKFNLRAFFQGFIVHRIPSHSYANFFSNTVYLLIKMTYENVHKSENYFKITGTLQITLKI